MIGAFNEVKRFRAFLDKCECAADLILIVFKNSNPLRTELERIEALGIQICAVELDELEPFSGYFDERTDKELLPEEFFPRKIGLQTREFEGTYYAFRWKVIWDVSMEVLARKQGGCGSEEYCN